MFVVVVWVLGTLTLRLRCTYEQVRKKTKKAKKQKSIRVLPQNAKRKT